MKATLCVLVSPFILASCSNDNRKMVDYLSNPNVDINGSSYQMVYDNNELAALKQETGGTILECFYVPEKKDLCFGFLSQSELTSQEMEAVKEAHQTEQTAAYLLNQARKR